MSSRSHFLSTGQILESHRLILFVENKILVQGDRFLWERSELGKYFDTERDFLLVDDEHFPVLAAHVEPQSVSTLDAETRSLRSLLFSAADSSFTLAGKANQLLEWYRTHRYCGACATATVNHVSERALLCPGCGIHYYPRINPCVIVLVLRGGQALLARSARYKTGFYSCLAGFIEVGETAEETIHREIREEVAVEVENIRYFKSQSWPFPSQLMLGYFADYKSGHIVPEPGEIETAEWFDADNLPSVPSADISVAGELIQHWAQHLTS